MTTCYSCNVTKKNNYIPFISIHLHKKQAIQIMSIVSHEIFIFQTPSNTARNKSTASLPGASSSPHSESQ